MPPNEFDSPQPARHERDNSEMIKKQLKGVFEFYCKQQQSVGPKSTFDNINHKCQAMNLGKFMTFSIAANILHSKDKAYSEGKLEKNQLMSVFKKAAGGVREIGFPVFMNIIEQLTKIDASIHDKLGLGEESLKGRDMQKLKYINLPFNTRDPQGRLPSPKRVFIPKLTAHSGKYEDSLRD